MSEAALTRAMIVNWALAELGIAPKFTDADSSTLGQQVTIFWQRCEAHCFGLHDWTFARATRKLTRRDETPNNGWAYAYDMPGDRIGPPLKVTTDPECRLPLRAYDIEGAVLYAAEPTAYARIRVAVDLAAWPPQFASAFGTALAHYLAVPLTQDLDMAASKKVEAFGRDHEGGAGGLFGRLIAQDRAGQPLGSPQLADDPFTAGRSGMWSGRW